MSTYSVCSINKTKEAKALLILFLSVKLSTFLVIKLLKDIKLSLDS